MKKIKVLRIIARLNVGGPAIHTILLTGGLDKTKFESLLIYGSLSPDEGDMSYYASDRNISTVFIPELKREIDLFNDLAAFIKIFSLIERERPDIVHTHTAKAGAIGRLAAIAFKLNNLFSPATLKIIHTFHGHVFDGYFGSLKTGVFILIERLLAIFTDQIITVSESVRNELISLGITKKSKIKVIPLGFELDRFLNLPLKDSPELNIGIVGRLVPIKNHRLFLDAAKKLICDNPDLNFSFKVIGDGESRVELDKYADLVGIREKVDFLGWQKDLEQVYSELDIVVLTSLNEGTPVSLIEAMASAKAVVATDVGGVADLLGKEREIFIKSDQGFTVRERGLLVKSGDSAAFARALTFLIKNNSLKKDMAESGRNLIKKKFTKERLIGDIQDLYSGILKVNIRHLISIGQ
ncbi:MAG: glycosyltransferase family 4 protein [Candidatus Omnitrophota bacterium]